MSGNIGDIRRAVAIATERAAEAAGHVAQAQNLFDDGRNEFRAAMDGGTGLDDVEAGFARGNELLNEALRTIEATINAAEERANRM